MPKYDMEKILPHKNQMVLIDDVLEYNTHENWVKTIVKIRPDSMLFEKEQNGVSSIAGLEYMAQTIGAYAYFKNNMQPPQMGFLLGTRKYENNTDIFECGKEYTIIAKENYTDNSIVSFECFIYNEEKGICANANVNVYVPKTEEEVMGVLNG